MRSACLGLAALVSLVPAQPVESQAPPGPGLSYADLADLVLAAPVVAHVRVDDSDALSDRETVGVPPGHRRFLIEATIVSLIRAEGMMPARIAWLVDLPDDDRGRRARVRRGTEYLLLAATVPGEPAELRLIAPGAQLPFTPATADRIRSILGEALDPSAPAPITGIGRAFHVPGSLPGESETQIFLQTADQRPISLSVLRRPGERPRWSVATGEMVDEAAEPPRPETFLWYRLACGLPPALPADALAEAEPEERVRIREDYRLVLDGLGPCTRGR